MMSFRLWIVVILFILAPARSQADPVLGGKGGLNLSTWNRHATEPSRAERHYQVGLSGGGYLQLRYLESVLPQVELLFTNRGTDATLDGQRLGSFDFNYIDLLLLGRAEMALDKVTLYALAGPTLNVLLTATVTSALGVTTDVREDYRHFDLGVLMGTGVAIGPFSWGTITVEGRYGRGFINVLKADDANGVSLTNQTIAFLIGYEYRRRGSAQDGAEE